LKLKAIGIAGFGLGLAAIAYAVVLLTAKPEAVDPAAVAVEGAEIGEAPLFTEVPAIVRIRNDSPVAIRFVGGPDGCQPGGCMHTTGPCPLTIPANSTAEVPLSVSASRPGPFRLVASIYLDLAGVSVERTVEIAGTGAAPPDRRANGTH
jgi:hypothetical protein